MSEGGEDDPAPLADLLDEIDAGGDDDDVWERLAAAVDADDGASPPEAGAASGSGEQDGSAELRERLSEAATAPEEPVGQRRNADRTPARATISNNEKIVHGYLTVLSFGAALVIYVAAVVGLLARPLWLLSLPPFAVGVVLLVPILALYLGVWDPTRIA